MPNIDPTTILQHSAGPIRWMPSGSPHRIIVDQHVYVIDTDQLIELDGIQETRFLNPGISHIEFEDPAITELSRMYPGLRPLADGGIWEGLATAITGQAVSLHSAAAFQRRLCQMFSPPIDAFERQFYAIPKAEQVAEATVEQIRTIGVTGKRAEGLIAVAREFARGNVPHPDSDDIDIWMKELNKLPMVGPWTSASTLLWGIGHPDAHPTGDVALLRAARMVYNDSSITLKDLDKMAERWRPQRAIAARLLWTHLLGMAWDNDV